jgi:chemotaxis signal transduction protein
VKEAKEVEEVVNRMEAVEEVMNLMEAVEGVVNLMEEVEEVVNLMEAVEGHQAEGEAHSDRSMPAVNQALV